MSDKLLTMAHSMIADPLTAVFLAIVISVFLWGTLRFLWPLQAISRQFADAAARLQHLKAPPRGSPFPSGSKRLGELWDEYIAQRTRAIVTVGQENVSTVAPEDIFTDVQILRGYNRNLAATLAGVFTGLGILGTFLGLVVGMAELNMTNPDLVIDSVNNLLGGMSAAFYTSIFGISASLGWLLLDRTLLRKMQRSLGDFFVAVHRHYPVESADALLHRLLAAEQEESQAIHRTNDILLEQKAILQNLGSDLATTFQSALERSFSATIAPSLDAMTGAVQDLSVKIGDRQVEALEEMVQSFQEQLAQQLGGQFESLAESIRGAAEWHEKVHRNVEGLVEQVVAASGEQVRLVEATSSAVDRFSQGVERLGEAHEHVLHATNQMSSAAAHTQALAAALAERVAEVQGQLEQFRVANSDLREAMADQLDAVAQQTSSLTGFWGEFRGDLQGLGGELRESVAEFRTVTEEKLGEIFARFDSEMAKVVQHLAGTLAELRDVTDELPIHVAKLNESMTSAAKDVGQAASLLPAAVNGMDERLKKIAELQESVVQLRGTLERAASHNTAESLQAAGISVEKLAERIDVSSETIHKLIDALRERPDGDSRAEVTVGIR